jgi:hypothetical protein
MPSELRLRGSRSRGGLNGARGGKRWLGWKLGISPWGIPMVPPAGIIMCRQLVISWTLFHARVTRSRLS